MLKIAYSWLKALILFFLLPLFFLLSFRFQTAISYASNETIVKVDPPYSYADVGETFFVNITIINVQNLYGVEIILRWDPSVLQATNLDIRLGVNELHPDGVLYNPLFIAKNEISKEEGKYFLAATSCSPAPPYEGSGNIARITFQVLTNGNCTLHLSSKLSDWPPPDRIPRISWPIEHVTIDGYFIIPEFPQAIITLIIFIILSFLFSVVKKERRKLLFSR